MSSPAVDDGSVDAAVPPVRPKPIEVGCVRWPAPGECSRPFVHSLSLIELLAGDDIDGNRPRGDRQGGRRDGPIVRRLLAEVSCPVRPPSASNWVSHRRFVIPLIQTLRSRENSARRSGRGAGSASEHRVRLRRIRQRRWHRSRPNPSPEPSRSSCEPTFGLRAWLPHRFR